MTTSSKSPARSTSAAIDITIQSVQLSGFSTAGPETGGSPQIDHYYGVPLYCHVVSAGPATYAILVNADGPNTFAPGPAGQITSVTVTVPDANPPGGQTMSFAPSDAAYNGLPSDIYLMYQDASNATLVIDQRQSSTAAKRASDSGNVPTITTITVDASETGTSNTLVFFTDIPLPKANVGGEPWTATITWTDGMGGAMGPIGGVNSP